MCPALTPFLVYCIAGCWTPSLTHCIYSVFGCCCSCCWFLPFGHCWLCAVHNRTRIEMLLVYRTWEKCDGCKQCLLTISDHLCGLTAYTRLVVTSASKCKLWTLLPSSYSLQWGNSSPIKYQQWRFWLIDFNFNSEKLDTCWKCSGEDCLTGIIFRSQMRHNDLVFYKKIKTFLWPQQLLKPQNKHAFVITNYHKMSHYFHEDKTKLHIFQSSLSTLLLKLC